MKWQCIFKRLMKKLKKTVLSESMQHDAKGEKNPDIGSVWLSIPNRELTSRSIMIYKKSKTSKCQ